MKILPKQYCPLQHNFIQNTNRRHRCRCHRQHSNHRLVLLFYVYYYNSTVVVVVVVVVVVNTDFMFDIHLTFPSHSMDRIIKNNEKLRVANATTQRQTKTFHPWKLQNKKKKLNLKKIKRRKKIERGKNEASIHCSVRGVLNKMDKKSDWQYMKSSRVESSRIERCAAFYCSLLCGSRYDFVCTRWHRGGHTMSKGNE